MMGSVGSLAVGGVGGGQWGLGGGILRGRKWPGEVLVQKSGESVEETCRVTDTNQNPN